MDLLSGECDRMPGLRPDASDAPDVTALGADGAGIHVHRSAPFAWSYF